MDTHFDDDPFFTTLLQSGGGGCNSTPTQHFNVVVQATPNDGEKRQPPKKVQRDASLTVEEDNLLISAWLNISIDAIRGTEQKSTQMWERITIFYHEYKKPNIANRSEAQVESLHPSGATEQDKTEKAKMLYKEMLGCNFTMEHCWCLLRHQPKWQQHISTFEVLIDRPQGKKAEKDRERKRKSIEGKDGEIKIALAKMTEDRAMSMEERRQGVLKADRERAATFELKKKKFKAKMMLLDLSNLNVMQQEYFGAFQLKIF
ncbi:hypothetical protein CIPAW_03G162700 [Carya illinoinensis]|uniref:No apical meristem-associated C-terminal domain-containing protein n=1 Tax=Carya illinoinensis TaxID=32201 RepID=A0A8T1R3G5_CARIL|nr:hypothetical protein CIPAW_03G162700 [Carya illinoinensis]